MKHLFLCLLANLLTALATVGQGTVLWNENLNGPLGSTYGTATVFSSLQIGTNSVIGATEIEPTGQSWLVHEDYFRFQLPPTLQVSAMALAIDKQNVWVWLGSSDFANQLGFVPNALNGNFLPQLGLQSFGSGNYGMYFANQDSQPFPSVANYRLDFVVTAVPEPSTWALFTFGSAFFWYTARRRSK